ncbi:MAG TPA: acyl-ACP--UDP-N-acetylglucosamine O-acyltransferase [Pyrinomonadaceae bacterium]|nr:acyl-ACP--UDP-N-acetylglucosamine O-acyltransferase [Pyrinomonadaceae bacterium]
MSAPSIENPSTRIHPTAVISSGAQIGQDCVIGPYAVIGEEVILGNRVRIDGHCVIDGRTRVGDESHFFPFVSVGLPPQDLKFAGEPSETEIGCRTRIREFVTVHRGTTGGGGVTRIGDDCFLMAQAHVAHDCLIGNNVIMANAATLAGHVIVEDRANIGAYSGVHQFCRVGREAYIGGYSVVVKDALPFALTVGNHAKCYGLNKVGMRRRGYTRETLDALHHAFHLLLSAKLNTTQAIERIREEITGTPEVDELVQFVESSRRGVVK